MKIVSEKRIKNKPNSVGDTLNDVLSKLNTFLKGQEKQDDIAIIGIEYMPEKKGLE